MTTGPVTGGADADQVLLLRPPDFVGRRRETSALTDALAHAPAVVIVEGEAGIGKSRLLQEFWASENGRRYRVLEAVCPPYREPYTLGPLVDAVRQATERLTALPLSDLAGALRALFPEWAADLPPAPEPMEDPRAARHRLFGALAELLASLDVGVLAVEDVHWADEATLEFLLFLTARQPPPVSLVLTYRPDDVPADSTLLRLFSRRPTRGGWLRLTLTPLDVTETAVLVSSMLADKHVSEDFAAFLHQRTAGLPLAVEESVRLMYDRADLAALDGEWMRRPLWEIDVPPTVRDAVLERAGRLGADARAVLRAGAVLAEPADEATLLAIVDLPAERARSGIGEALATGLLREDARGLLSCRHALARQALYDAIPAPERRAMHLRSGQIMEGWSPLPVARLALQFRAAGAADEWRRYAEQAADAALASGDEATAAGLLLDLTGNAAPSAHRALVRLASKIGFGASAVGDSRYQDLLRALRAVLETRALDPGEKAELRFQIGRILLMMEELQAAYLELELAVAHLEPGSSEAVQAMTLLGWARATTWPAAVHLRWVRRAAEADPTGPDDRSPAAVDRACALLLVGDESGWNEATRIPDDVPAGKERPQVTRGQMNLAYLALMWGHYADARKRIATTLELARANDYLRYQEKALMHQVYLDWQVGAWDGLADRAIGLADRAERSAAYRHEAILVTGLLHTAVGEHGPAEARLRSVLDAALRGGSVDQVAEPAAALASLWLTAGRVDDALAATDTAIDIIVRKGIWVWAADLGPVRVDALVQAGRVEEAAALTASFGRGLRVWKTPVARAALTLCRALVAEGRGEPTRAATLFARVATRWDALPRPYYALLAEERRAHCLLAAGREDAAVPLLSRVFQGLSELGASAAADRTMRALREHGVDARRSHRGRPGYGDALSPREKEVVRLLLGGRTNRQIAAALVVSAHTVASHVNSAMRKLRVTSRTALAVSAVELGLVPDDRNGADID